MSQAVVNRVSAKVYDGQGDELGPIASFGCQFFVGVAFTISFYAIGVETLPAMASVGLFAGVLGILVLAPRRVLHHIPVSLSVIALIGWMAMSTWWTANPQGTAIAITREVPIYLGMVLVIGMMPMRHLLSALLWAIRIVVLVSVVAIILLPEARIHFDDSGQNPPLPGWHGLFPHKNVMTPFLTFGVLTILTFDRSRWLKYGTLGTIAVVMVGSDSVTGLSSVTLAVGIWVWLQLYRNLDIRGSSVFVLSTVVMALAAVVGLVASISSVVDASGKDVTFTGRTFIWDGVATAIAERPFIGWGMNGILAAPVTPQTVEVWREIGFEPPHAHNGLLDLWVELGIVGVVLFSIIYVGTLIDGAKLVRENPKIGAWVVSILAVQVFISISEPVFVGIGWFSIMVMLRTVTLRRYGMEFEAGSDLATRLQTHRFRPQGWSRI